MREEKRLVYDVRGEEVSGNGDVTARRLTFATAWAAARIARDNVFGAHLFINPAWDILLILYIDHVKDGSSAVTQVCQASTAPITTALRWIAALEALKLVHRIPDPRDRRRTFLALTPQGLLDMERAIDDATASSASLGVRTL